MILILWVDTCLIFARKEQLADDVITSIYEKLTPTEEEDVSSYLSVQLSINNYDTVSKS